MRPIGPGTPGRPPSLPKPGELNSPYTLVGNEVIEDATAWQLWWEFNKDPYLRLNTINTANRATLGSDFFLGVGEKQIQRGGRASAQTVQTKVVPALKQAIELGGSNEFVQGAMVAISKIGGDDNLFAFEYLLKYFLSNGQPIINQTAAVSFGILADGRLVPILEGLALDNEAGRKLCESENVDTGVRAFAAYGLGLIGGQSQDIALRSKIVKTLIGLLEEPVEESHDVQVAAMVALGLVPLQADAKAIVCLCGECVVEGPETSLQAQITYLLRYFTAEKEFDPTIRAHTATTLGRLVAAEPDGMLEEIKEGVAEFLIGSLERNSRQPTVVKQSSVLALGLIGDADDSNVDKWIRWALNRSAGHGDPLERRYALIAMAQVGGREGQGENAFAGTASVRKDILHHMSRGKKQVKPWAGLALGVLGHGLDESGVPLDSAADKALLNVMRNTKSVNDLGAYALASGLRRNQEAAPLLLKKMEKLKDEGAQAYAALGLGLMGARESIEPLQNVLRDADDKPLLKTRAGLALGLLGDTAVVHELIETLAKNDDDTTKAAVAAALGFIGDERSIDSLIELMLDKDAPDATREAAVTALGFVSDRSMIPWRAALAVGANYRAETATLTSGAGQGVLDLD